MTIPSIVALIPARAGSKRVPDKNIKPLAEHPAIAYTISAALESNVFKDVIVSTDSQEYADIGIHYGAAVPFLRPHEISGDVATDFEWIQYTLHKLAESGKKYDCFSILRPTSPFRQSSTIERAWKTFLNNQPADSLRAVEKCKQHPGKMWVLRNNRMLPLLPYATDRQPWHSSQYADLPEMYAQNASLEIAWVSVIEKNNNISGENIIPFITEESEGFDINKPIDWRLAEMLIASNEILLPSVIKTPYHSEKRK